MMVSSIRTDEPVDGVLFAEEVVDGWNIAELAEII
jgi:hypothetical protein